MLGGGQDASQSCGESVCDRNTVCNSHRPQSQTRRALPIAAGVRTTTTTPVAVRCSVLTEHRTSCQSCRVTSSIGVDGVEALRDAAAAVGLGVEPNGSSPDVGADVVVVTPSGDRILLQLKQQSLVAAEGLDQRIARWMSQAPDSSGLRAVVADRVTSEARAVLKEAGWGWLDLRGHLHLAGPGLFVDAAVPAMRESSLRSAPLAGRVGVEVAAQLLLSPDQSARVRQIATELGRAPSSVSHTLTAMQEAGLIDAHRRPAVPELFWELAAIWQPIQADVKTVPAQGDGAVNDALKLGLDAIATTVGWALSESVAAATYGAPVALRSDHPPDFYVPNSGILRRAVHLLGAAADHDTRIATLRVAPVPMVCASRIDPAGWADEVWPLASPLFVALDLAQDAGRGREVLDGWTPHHGGPRVW